MGKQSPNLLADQIMQLQKKELIPPVMARA